MLLKDGRPKRMLLESEIIAAQSIAKSEQEAGRILGVSHMTYRKYARMYGLLGRVKNRAGRGILKAIKNEDSGKYPLDKILQGKFPHYSTNRLKVRMIRSGRKVPMCDKCGFCEHRVSDNTVPLLLAYKDGNLLNKLENNIEFLCYNCFYLYVNNPFGHRKTFLIEEPETHEGPGSRARNNSNDRLMPELLTEAFDQAEEIQADKAREKAIDELLANTTESFDPSTIL